MNLLFNNQDVVLKRIIEFLRVMVRGIHKVAALYLSILDKRIYNHYLKFWMLATVGEGSVVIANASFDVFRNKEGRKLKRPLVTIGRQCVVAAFVQFITHDTSYAFFGHQMGKHLPKKWGEIIVEDHVFIGQGVIILPGVRIGKRTLIGAGSVVTKNCRPNSVYAGNPARRICSIREYLEK